MGSFTPAGGRAYSLRHRLGPYSLEGFRALLRSKYKCRVHLGVAALTHQPNQIFDGKVVPSPPRILHDAEPRV